MVNTLLMSNLLGVTFRANPKAPESNESDVGPYQAYDFLWERPMRKPEHSAPRSMRPSYPSDLMRDLNSKGFVRVSD
jgi:hypothetical protein